MKVFKIFKENEDNLVQKKILSKVKKQHITCPEPKKVSVFPAAEYSCFYF